MQPLISLNFGDRNYSDVTRYRLYSIITALIFGVVFLGIGVILGKSIASMFVADNPNVVAMSTRALKIYFMIFIFMGINLVIATYFQSIENGGRAFVIMIGRGMIAPTLCIYIMRIFGEAGIWLAQPAGEAIICTMSAFMLYRCIHTDAGEFTS
jgi:Na+-driven multidrug efflux pump